MKDLLSLAFVGLLDGAGFALLGEFLLAVARMAGPAKRNQKVLPLHTALRCAQGSFAPPLLQGPAYKGRPWPFKPLAASMRLAPLRNGSTHPPERGGWCRLWVRTKKPCQRHITILQATRTPLPVRRPSGGVAQGDVRQDAERGTKGQGRPFVTAPGAAPERGKSGRRPDPDVGRAFSLVTFSFARAKRK